MSRFATLLLPLVLVAPLAGGHGAAYAQSRKAPAPVSAMSMVDPVGSFAPMLSRVIPAVVTILVVGEMSVASELPARADAAAGAARPIATKQRFRSGGSGVIIDPARGIILTNNHVIENAVSIDVVLSDGQHLEAKLIGRDVGADIAVVEVAGGALPSLPIGNSDQVRVGDVVAAVGNPFGLEGTATLGIVSATMRTEVGHGAFEDFLQIDALVNPGNSGGALVDVRGRLIGINTAIAGGEGRNTGIGFAIPIRMARIVADEIIAHGRMRRGSPGLIVEDLTVETMRAIGTRINRGAIIRHVVPGSTAAAAGIKPGGVITMADDRPVRGAAEFNTRVATVPAGSHIAVVVSTNGKETRYDLVASEIVIAPDATELPPDAGSLAGLVVGDIRLGNRYFGDLRGSQVLRLPETAPASVKDLAVGDVVTAVDDAPVRSSEELSRRIARTGMQYRLKIVRDGIPAWVRVAR